MKLLPRAHTSQRRLIEILRVIDEADKPIGARAISDALGIRGYELGERAVRYNLKILDELGFTEKNGYSGRILTQLGIKELSYALVSDRIGFVNTRIEEYMYRTTFDLDCLQGDVISNISFVDKAKCERALEIITDAFDAGYTISKRVAILEEGDAFATFSVPRGCLGIATMCSITVDGMLLRRGMPVNTSFAGVVQVRDGQPEEFTDLIAYAGSSLDPMKIFMARKMAKVGCAIKSGEGRVLANVREVPIAASSDAREILSRLKRSGIGGLIKIGGPGEPILGCPVSPGKVGIAICAGVNGAMAAEESGINIATLPISALVDYSAMREVEIRGQERSNSEAFGLEEAFAK